MLFVAVSHDLLGNEVRSDSVAASEVGFAVIVDIAEAEVLLTF